MVEVLPPVLILAIVAALWWAFTKPPALFVVRVREGRPDATSGKITEAFRVAVADIFQEFGVQSGEIRGVAQGGRIGLWFSSGIPPNVSQRKVIGTGVFFPTNTPVGQGINSPAAMR